MLSCVFFIVSQILPVKPSKADGCLQPLLCVWITARLCYMLHRDRRSLITNTMIPTFNSCMMGECRIVLLFIIFILTQAESPSSNMQVLLIKQVRLNAIFRFNVKHFPRGLLMQKKKRETKFHFKQSESQKLSSYCDPQINEAPVGISSCCG